MRIGKYPRSLVGNMDETPGFFDMVPSKSICKTGSKECIARTSGSEKKHAPIVLSATADGKMLPPMIIFKGKTTKTIEKLRVPNGFIVKTHAKAWMDEELMHVWLEDIWLKHTKLMSQKLGFENSLLTFDAFSAHKTDEEALKKQNPNRPTKKRPKYVNLISVGECLHLINQPTPLPPTIINPTKKKLPVAK